MKNKIAKFILDRNFILILALVLGLSVGKWASFLQNYTFYILATVMTFSMTGISSRSVFPLKTMCKPMLMGAFLSYVVFGFVILSLAYFLMPTEELFLGFVVIAATPPGVVVVPFSHILKGDLKYAVAGTLGAFLSSLFFTPFIIELFHSEAQKIDKLDLLLSIFSLVLIPLLLSRLLLWHKIKACTEKLRGRVVDWGFALIIFTAVGLNQQVFLSNFGNLFVIFVVLFLGIFGLGFVFEILSRKINIPKPHAISQNLLLTTKSSGFAIVTALSLFGKEVAIPSAVLSVVIVAYLLFLSIREKIRDQHHAKSLFEG